MKRIKVIPRKSETLCRNCAIDSACRASSSCDNCPMDRAHDLMCKCVLIANGEPCKYFKRKERYK